MLDQMSSSEFVEWESFFSVEPMPAERADLRTAEQTRVAIWAATRGKSTPRTGALVPDWWGKRSGKQSPAQIAANLSLTGARPRARKKAK